MMKVKIKLLAMALALLTLLPACTSNGEHGGEEPKTSGQEEEGIVNVDFSDYRIGYSGSVSDGVLYA